MKSEQTINAINIIKDLKKNNHGRTQAHNFMQPFPVQLSGKQHQTRESICSCSSMHLFQQHTFRKTKSTIQHQKFMIYPNCDEIIREWCIHFNSRKLLFSKIKYLFQTA